MRLSNEIATTMTELEARFAGDNLVKIKTATMVLPAYFALWKEAIKAEGIETRIDKSWLAYLNTRYLIMGKI